ncbi:MAG: ATP-dependent Clp protease ATP-binding subunit, partial [Patescibacteria group bacterium]
TVKGLADDWVYGYTPTLNAYGKEVAVRSVRSEEHMHILMRKEEAEEIETILARSGKNNVVLVGESGVGKTSVVQGFAQRVYLGTTQSSLQHKRVFELDVNLILARARDTATAIDLFEKLLTECERAGNIILVIDNIHNFVGPQHREEVGAIDISGILIPHLQSDRFQLIAVTDHASYHTNIERVPSLAVLFEKVQIRELNEEQTLAILQDITPKLERRHGLLISYYALWEAVSASGSFIQNVPFPEKAISLLTETLSFVASHPVAGKVVTQDHVTEIISKKTGIPLGRIEGDEKAKLLNMEELLHKRIIGQHEAIVQIASALRRIRSGITERKRPIGTFLFLGPTGVGKTETAKALAAVYFGAEERMIRLDMTEYQSADSINRLIGNVDTQTEAQFANDVRSNPFSIVVLDELEKAHPNILNLFLQILDEGRLTDAFQKKVSFRNTIIIATSNAGSEFIREYVKTGQDTGVIQMKLFEHLLKGNTFKPEFMNRFDAIIVFRPLIQEEVKQVAALMLTDLKKRLEQKGYVFLLADDALEAIAQRGFDVEFGARAMRRFIQEHVENRIADRIIKGEYLEGDTITVTAADVG